jgi:hypothetical protein
VVGGSPTLTEQSLREFRGLFVDLFKIPVVGAGKMADLSAWMGKPPSGPEHFDSGQVENEANVESEPAPRSSQSGTDAEPYTGSEAEPDTGSEAGSAGIPSVKSRNHSEPDSRSSSVGYQNGSGIYIDVPRIHDKEDYEHLPGYFTVHRIIREVKPGCYLAKLKSGEFDQVSNSIS